MTLYELVSEALDRLGDLDNDIWSRSEMELYAKDGYDSFCRRAKPLFDIHVIDNVPKVGNWQTDLEKYIAESKPGWALSDEPFHMTAEHERNLGVAGGIGGTYSGPANITSNFGRSHVGVSGRAGEDIPSTVPGGRLPQSTVEVLRVAFDQQDLAGISSQQMRDIDVNYETRSGDPKWFIHDKDGLYYLRVVPAAQGDAVYPTVNGGFGTITESTDTASSSTLDGLIGYWPLEETATPWLDVIGTNHLSTAFGGGQATAAGIHNAGLLLDGSSIGSANAIDNTAVKSFSFWLNPPVTGSVVDIFVPSATSATLQYVGASDTLRLSQSGTTAGTAVLSPGTFYHVVMTYDGTDTRVYVNTALDITHAGVGVGSGTFALWSATFDEVAQFNKVLDSAEIASLYNAGIGSFYPDFVIPAITTVVTTEVNGSGTGGYGILRYRSDSEALFPSGGPWGSPTRIHPDTSNIKVEYYRLGRNLTTHASELPSAYNKYVVYWAMNRALKRSGPGQDIELAEHYAQRFEMGVSRMIDKRNSIQPERVGRFGGQADGAEFGLGLPLPPYPYENPWRQ